MKSITQLYSALIRVICLSLAVLSLGSVLMAAPSSSAPASPFVSNTLPVIEAAKLDAQMHLQRAKTPADYIPQPTATGVAQVQSTVQTNDLTLPAYGSSTTPITIGTNGIPTGATPDNRDPAWSTTTEKYIIFSSNRTSATNPTPGTNYHLYSIDPSGDAASIVQLTSGTGNEFYPTILPGDNEIAFCEGTTANANGNLTLYYAPMPSGSSPLNPTAIGSGATPAATGFYVRHPSFNGSVIAFAGTPTNSPLGPYHIWTFNIFSNQAVEITGGSADEEDPAFSPDGSYIAFDSTASGYTYSSGLSMASGTQANRMIWAAQSLGQQVAVQMTSSSTSSVQPAWSFKTDNALTGNGTVLYLFFSQATTTSSTGFSYGNAYQDIFYTEGGFFNSSGVLTLTPQSATTQVDTSEPEPTSSNPSPQPYNNTEPAVSLLQSYVAVTYISPRFIVNPITENPTGDDSAIDVEPTEAPTIGGTGEILMSQLFDIDAPAILPYDSSTGEIVHTELTSSEQGGVPGTGASQRQFLPGNQVTFVVRLSDRQSGVAPNEWIQIKDPNSKYQQGSGLEHKVFTREPDFDNPDDVSSPALTGQPTNVGGYDEATTLWTFENTPATADVNGNSPVYVGNVYPVTSTASNQTTIDSTSGVMAGATTITVPANILDGPGGFDSAVGQIIQVGTGADEEYTTLENVIPATGSATTATLDVAALLHAHGNNETVKVVEQFDPLGNEVDCEAINANGGSQVDATNPSNFQVPIYTPAVDTAVYSGSGVYSFPPSVWLKLTPCPVQDQSGGVLYYATWTTPTLPSDWYLDVISFDNAPTGRNWSIYDNVWGMTTASFAGNSGVLVVDDYALPQKFFSARFELANAANNVPITFFGAESYITDLDDSYSNDVLSHNAEAALPDYAFSSQSVLTGAVGNPPPPAILEPIYHASNLLPNWGQTSETTGAWPWNQASTGGPGKSGNYPQSYLDGYANALGVNSYADEIEEGGTDNIPQVDSAPEAGCQQYDIWRILARGPIPANVIANYDPTIQQQPANPFVTGSKPTNVQVATKCVLWISPFTTDEFAGPGTLADAQTQSNLETFLNNGGRLFVEGIDVGYGLTGDGNVPNNFYSKYLQANFVNDDAGYSPTNVNLTGSGTQKDYISHDAYYNNTNDPQINMNYTQHGEYRIPTTAAPYYYQYAPPSSEPLAISNYGFTGQPTTVRSDSALNELGSALINHGWIDAFTPTGNDQTELSGNNGAGLDNDLIYYINPTTGAIVSYSSFGLEAVSQQVFLFTPPPPAGGTTLPPYWVTPNQRTDLMHNMICFMRTGSLKGQVTSTATAGQGVPDAIVVATLQGNANPVYTAKADSNGNYEIDGMPPGLYAINAYASGYFAHGQQVVANKPFHGDDFATLSIQINPANPGSLQVTVEDSVTKNPIAGVTVIATDIAGAVSYNAVTNGSGVATFSRVNAGQYNLTYSATSVGYGNTPVSQTPTNPVTVTTNQQTSVTTTLTAAPAIIYGTVSDAGTSQPLTQGTVTVTNSSGTVIGTASISSTLPPNPVSNTENYQVTVPAGSNYTVTAVAVGYNQASVTGVTVVAGQNQQENFSLTTAQPGKLYGIVGVAPNPETDLAGGITVTATDATGKQYTFTTSATSSPAPDNGIENWNSGSTPLPAGPYTITINVANPPPAVAVIITSGAQVRVPDIAIQPTYQSGLTFFSSPYDFSQSGLPLSTILGYPNPTLAVWDPSQSNYVLTPSAGQPANMASQIVLGQGYWARFPGPVFLDIAGGTPAPTTGPFSITLKAGWNMIGDPFTGSVNMSDLQVADVHGTLHSWQSATSAGLSLVNPILYSYDPSGQYDEHYVGSTVGSANSLNPTLAPFVGYWVEAFTTCALEVSPPPAVPASLQALATTGSVALSWNAAAGASGYNVYRGTTAGQETLFQTGVKTPSFTDSGDLTNGTTYFYEVTATNAAGESGRSNEVSATP